VQIFQMLKNNRNTYLIVLGILFLFYVFFPTHNSTLDAYSYAGYIKYKQHLFTPHHLFYNVFMYVINQTLSFVGVSVEVLPLTKMVNSVFAVLNLFVFYKILSLLKLSVKEKLVYILILGFSFSQWRFGTENETYTIPISFSLVASYFFLKYISKQQLKYIFYSGLFASVACLFHQIHFFWWLGLMIGFFLYDKKFKTLVLYSITALLVPFSYVLVLIYYEHKSFSFFNLYSYVFNDLIGGSVMTNFGWKGIFFQVLNSFRTFFQIHPNSYYLIKENIVFALPLLLGAYLAYRFVMMLYKKQFLERKEHQLQLYTNIHLGIFIANFLFAYYNYGNIEFMVMLPFLLFLILIIRFSINFRFLKLTALTLFVWNFFYGIYPNYHYNYYNDQHLVNYIIKNPETTFIVKNPAVINEHFYKTGVDNDPRIILYYQINEKGVDSLVQLKTIYTDLIDKPEILNKEKMTADFSLQNVFKKYKKKEVLHYNGFYGRSTVYKITK